MKVEVPDIVVYGFLTVAVATALVYAGVIIGRRGSGEKNKYAANLGSPSPRRKKSKNKSRNLGSLPGVAAETNSGADVSAQQEVDDAELTEDDFLSNSNNTSGESKKIVKGHNVATSKIIVDMEPPLLQEPPREENLDDFNLVTKKKDKKKGSATVAVAPIENTKKIESDSVNGAKEAKNGSHVGAKVDKKKKSKAGGGEVAAESEIEREVVTEAVKELTTEEVSSATLTAAQKEIALAIAVEAALGEGGVGAGSGAAAATDDDDGWNVVNKRAKSTLKADEIAASAKNEKGKNKNDVPSSSSSSSSGRGAGKGDSGGAAPAATARSSSSEDSSGGKDDRGSPSSTVPSPGPAPCTEVITIDLKHLGAVIGTKGSTRMALQKLYDTTISVPKTERSSSGPIDVTITGLQEGIKGTVAGIRQLCEKGYAPALGGEGFSEGALQVHPHFMSEIVGKNGHCAKAIQDKMEVRLIIPQGSTKTASQASSSGETVQPVRVGIAGMKDKVKRTKELIKELIKYHHTEVTHPGLSHIEMENIPVAAHSLIIGKKGSEIARISSTFGVSVHIPYGHSISQNVVIVGRGDGLKGAEEAVRAIVEKFEQKERDAALAKTPANSASATATVASSADAAAGSVTEAKAEGEGKSKGEDEGKDEGEGEGESSGNNTEGAAAPDPVNEAEKASTPAEKSDEQEEGEIKEEEEEEEEEEEGGDDKLQLDELGSHKHS